jgi:hypothetical protein
MRWRNKLTQGGKECAKINQGSCSHNINIILTLVAELAGVARVALTPKTASRLSNARAVLAANARGAAVGQHRWSGTTVQICGQKRRRFSDIG